MSDKIVGRCPYCGKEIEIPAELSEFSCLYCGKRSHMELLTAQQEFQVGDLLELASQLPQTLHDHDTLCKKINKKEYAPTFAAYEAAHQSLLKRIDSLILVAPMELDEAVRILCTTFLDTLDGNLRQDPRFGKKQGRSALLFEIKVALALFLTPLTRKLELRMAESFCTILHNLWMERYPDESWLPGVYETIIGGFRQKKLCFITTAVCSHEGKADDCRELTALRAFRDGWLTDHDGESLIAEYYAIAPTLVTLMEHCDASRGCYSEIRTRWLEPCLSALEVGQQERCRDIYVDMVQVLRSRYLQ